MKKNNFSKISGYKFRVACRKCKKVVFRQKQHYYCEDCEKIIRKEYAKRNKE